MDRRNADYVWLDTNLRKAMADGHLLLHYQPKLSGRTGELDGVEALLRWKSPERGMVGPGAFIPYAEDSGLIAPLGVWVMREAARQAAAWKREGLNIRVAVNVSARQLEDKGLVSEFMSALSDAGLDPCMLDIELTESCLIEDEHSAIELIKQFRKLGARVHLDDFGTGYSRCRSWPASRWTRSSWTPASCAGSTRTRSRRRWRAPSWRWRARWS